MKLSAAHAQAHHRALQVAKGYLDREAELVEILQQVDRLKIYKQLGKNSLFVYATELLGLDKSVAYPLITVARKAMDVPQLKAALKQKKVTLSKASRIVSILDSQNAAELIAFAESHTRDELDRELAKRNPKAAVRDRMKNISEDLVEIRVTISRSTFDKMKRVESLHAQKQKGMKGDDVLSASFEAYLDKNDPVRKAARAKNKRALLPARVEVTVEGHYERIPLTGAQKHAVFKRDQGRCTHIGLNGKRCNVDRWIQVHHIIPVSRGGTNDLENLTTLIWMTGLFTECWLTHKMRESKRYLRRPVIHTFFARIITI